MQKLDIGSGVIGAVGMVRYGVRNLSRIISSNMPRVAVEGANGAAALRIEQRMALSPENDFGPLNQPTENQFSSPKIADNVTFNSGGDRLIGSIGSARNSAELGEIQSSLRTNGVDVRYSTNEFAYGPASAPGQPGNIVFDPDASISAIRHDYGHFLDDKALGFPGQRFYYENPQFRVATERRQYLYEIKTARQAGDADARRMLIQDYLSERQYLIDTYYFAPDGTKIPYSGPIRR